MSAPWLLTTPASRGIGLALATHLLATTRAPVVATARSDLSGARDRILAGLPRERRGGEAEERLHVLEVDMMEESSIAAAASACKAKFPPSSHHLHLGLLVPGMLHPEKAPAQISAPEALHTLQLNLLAPMLLAKHFTAFLPRKATQLPPPSPSGPPSSAAATAPQDKSPLEGLPPSATLALMSARVGSVSDNRAGGWYSYRASKAGVTQLAKSLDIFLRMQSGEKALCVALHPGTVKTGLSKGFWDSEGAKANGGEGLFAPDRAASQLVDVLRGLGGREGAGRGGFWDWKGEEISP